LIRADRIRLIDQDGEMIGVVTVPEALRRAEEVGLDLVEISPNADPPVCKILDYGKYKYELQKKAAEARKKQKTVELKELKIRPSTDEHDYTVKMKAARRFLEEGNKVKFAMRFRGREMENKAAAESMFNRLKADLTDLGKVEQEPRQEGRQMHMIMAPT
jgi:translation initiation factor IF-3